MNESQLVPDTLATWEGVLKVVDGPSALLLWQLADKLVKVLVLRGLEDDDGFLVVGQAEDDVCKLFASLELLELLKTFLGLWGMHNEARSREWMIAEDPKDKNNRCHMRRHGKGGMRNEGQKQHECKKEES